MFPVSSAYSKIRDELGVALWEVGAILTKANRDHPLFVVREDGECGFLRKAHEKDPTAPLAPFYLNLRTPENPKPGPLTPAVVALAARCLRGLHCDWELSFDAIAGVPRAGDPIAFELAHLSGKPCISLGKWEHGNKRCVAGINNVRAYGSVTSVLLVDDLIGDATSKLEAIYVLRGENFAVTDVAVIADNERGGHDALAFAGCRLHSIFYTRELMEMGVALGKISEQDDFEIHAYLAHEALAA